MKINPPFKKISFRLAKYAVIIALFLGIIVSLFQLFLDLKGERKRLGSTMQQVLNISKASAVQAVIDLDKELAVQVSNGLFELTPVLKVEIKDNFGDSLVLAEREHPEAHPALQWFVKLVLEPTESYSINLMHPKYNELMGVMSIEVDNYSFTQGFFRRAVVILLSGLVLNFILAFLLFFLFHFILTRPLSRIITAFTQISPDDTDHSTITACQIDREDELGILVRTINELLARYNDTIARLKQTEEVVRGSEERVRLLLNSSAEAIYGIDLDGNCTFVNLTCVRLLGYKEASELIGKNIHDLIHHSTPDGEPIRFEDCRIHKAYLVTEQVNVDDEYLWRADGSYFPAEYWAQPTIENDEVTGAVVTFIDISKRVTLEKERSHLESQLLHAQKMESVGRLAGGLAHDFNNALSSILGYSELLLMEVPTDAPFMKDIQMINLAGEKAAALTNQLLAFSRKQVLNVKPICVNTVIDHLLKMLSKTLGEDIEIDIRKSATNPIVEADQGQIEQVLVNLAVNARDAMPQGGRLIIETQEIHLDETYTKIRFDVEPGPYVLITVTDYGEGMGQGVLEHIFDPFFTTKEKGKGTGLGLATAHGIIKQHNGQIYAYSEPGAGTTFEIYLPASSKTPQEEGEVEESAPLRKGDGETVLIVDDDPSIRELIIATLVPWGYTCLEASCGAEAMKFTTVKPQILITDVVMPGMSGKELADFFLSESPATKIIFMSGYADNTVVHHGVVDPTISFIQKPVTPGVLLLKVCNTLNE